MKRSLFSLLAVLAICGCSRELNIPSEKVTKVTANIEELTKVTGDRNGHFTWSAGDAIGIWTGSSFTKFDIDPSTLGTANIVFKCEGEIALDENSFAVYPYSASSTYDSATHKYKSGNLWNVQLYSAPQIAGESVSYSFKHLSPVIRFEIANLPAEATAIFFETYAGTGYFMRDEATAILSDEEPVLSAGRLENKTYNLTKTGSELVYVPVLAETFSNEFQGVKLVIHVKDVEFKTIQRLEGVFSSKETAFTFERGKYYYLPTMVYPTAGTTTVSATMEGGLTWLEGQNIGLRKTATSLSEFSLTAPGSTEGAFTGTIYKSSGLAVAPFKGATLNGNTISYAFSSSDYPTVPAMYAMLDTSNSSSLSYPFKHLGAVIRVTLNNIPAATNYVFLECGARHIFYWNASADLGAENPSLVATTTGESMFVKVPEHSGDIASWSFYLPILTGEYETPPWGFKAECYEAVWNWETKTSNKPQSNELNFTANGGIHRGDIFNVNLTFEAL